MLVYVCSPFAADKEHTVEEHRDFTIEYCRRVIDQGHMPVASHLLYPQILNDSNPTERQLGLDFGLKLISLCDQLWVFGDRISDGMEKEINFAKARSMRVKYHLESEESS